MDISCKFGYRPIQHTLDFGGVWFDTLGGDVMAQEVELEKEKLTFGWVTVKFCVAQGSHDQVNVLYMFGCGIGPDHDIVQVDMTNFSNILTQWSSNMVLVNRWCISQPFSLIW